MLWLASDALLVSMPSFAALDANTDFAAALGSEYTGLPAVKDTSQSNHLLAGQ